MLRKSLAVFFVLGLILLQASDPLKIVREKGFYKTGKRAENRSFIQWLKKPVFGTGHTRHKVPASLQVLRDKGYKEKEARLNARDANRSVQTGRTADSRSTRSP